MQAVNVEVKNLELKASEKKIVLILELDQYGIFSFVLNTYEKLVELLETFEESLIKLKYARILIDDKNQVQGLAHITKGKEIIFASTEDKSEAPVV